MLGKPPCVVIDSVNFHFVHLGQPKYNIHQYIHHITHTYCTWHMTWHACLCLSKSYIILMNVHLMPSLVNLVLTYLKNVLRPRVSTGLPLVLLCGSIFYCPQCHMATCLDLHRIQESIEWTPCYVVFIIIKSFDVICCLNPLQLSAHGTCDEAPAGMARMSGWCINMYKSSLPVQWLRNAWK